MDRLLSSGNSSGFLSKKSYAEIVGSQQSGSVERKIGGVETIPSLSGVVRTAILSAVHTELQTKDKRAYNIVITGMPISGIASDATQFSELCISEFNVRPSIRSTSRLGKVIEDKIQPLLVTLYTTSEVDELVSRAKQLRFSRSRQVRDRIYLNRHLTRAEALAAFNERSLRRLKQSNKQTEDSNGTHNMDLETQHLDVAQDPGLIPDAASLPQSLNPSVPSFHPVSHQSSVLIPGDASSSSSSSDPPSSDGSSK